MAEIIVSGKQKFLHLHGFLYYLHYSRKDSSYWQCRRKPDCSARAITRMGPDQSLIVRKGPEQSVHSHAPNREEVSALTVISSIKRRAADHPEAPPAQIMRRLNDVPVSVLAELPARENVKKLIQRVKLRELPANPTSIEELGKIPDRFRVNTQQQPFLLYDSHEDEDYDQGDGRIIIYATRENLRLLFLSRIWYVDGTFKSAPAIFFQLFAILGSVTQKKGGVDHILALPFVYALLENKQTSAYEKVFDVVRSAVQRSALPQIVMTDFEMAIINAVNNTLPGVDVKACFFHLCQNVFRRIQAEGLTAQYNSAEDRTTKHASQQMCALAFVPIDAVKASFDLIEFPDDFGPVANYFEDNYVLGRPARGRRKAVQPRFPPALWNQYNSTLQKLSRTNNASEGWHNRLNIVIGRPHPSLYAFLQELQQEQADTECMISQITLGQRIKKSRAPAHQRKEERIFNIVSSYEEFVEANDVIGYLTAIGHNLHF